MGLRRAVESAGGVGNSLMLDAVVSSEANSFNAVRFNAAAAVVISHSYAMTETEHVSEPLFGPTPYTLGQHAVNVFFVLSGLMLSRSHALNPNLWRFVSARLLRVFPGLFGCGVVTTLVLGALGTTASPATYFQSPATLLYPFVVPLAFNRASLPDVFAHGTYAGSVNGSLWTIKYELLAYAAFIAAAAIGLLRRRLFPLMAAGLLTALVIGLDLFPWAVERWGVLAPLSRFLMSFAIGVAAYRHRDQVPLEWPVLAALLALAVALHDTSLEKAAYILLAGYGAVFAGDLRLPGLSAFASRTDLSYGLYLYAWPTQQLLLHHWPSFDAVPHIAASLALALPLAGLSWILIERPSLSLKRGLRTKVPTKPTPA